MNAFCGWDCAALYHTLQVNDIKEVRIDKALNKIGEAIFVVLPEDISWTPTEFLNHTKEHSEALALELDMESRKVSLLCQKLFWGNGEGVFSALLVSQRNMLTLQQRVGSLMMIIIHVVIITIIVILAGVLPLYGWFLSLNHLVQPSSLPTMGLMVHEWMKLCGAASTNNSNVTGRCYQSYQRNETRNFTQQL